MAKTTKSTKPTKTLNFHFDPKHRSSIDDVAKILARQINRKNLEKKYIPVKHILKLVGAGVFLTASIAIPNLPMALKPFLDNPEGKKVSKRFNLPYLERTLLRLQSQRLIDTDLDESGRQIVKINDNGRKKILKYALDEMTVEKPKIWDGYWRLVSYDFPVNLKNIGNAFRSYLEFWNFYPLHKSLFLHAYPCEKQVDFLREYFGIGKHVLLFKVTHLENDKPFRGFFAI